jgi:hypothetical protein
MAGFIISYEIDEDGEDLFNSGDFADVVYLAIAY